MFPLCIYTYTYHVELVLGVFRTVTSCCFKNVIFCVFRHKKRDTLVFPNVATELTRGMLVFTTQLISPNCDTELASIIQVMSAEPTQIIIR